MPSRHNTAERNSAELNELLSRSDTVFKETRRAMASPTAESLQAAGDHLDEIIESSKQFADTRRKTQGRRTT
jgi:hypothetical protein